MPRMSKHRWQDTEIYAALLAVDLFDASFLRTHLGAREHSMLRLIFRIHFELTSMLESSVIVRIG